MKKMILTAVMLAAAALCRAQQPAETGERREWLTSFTAVEVSAPLDVKFVQVPDTEAPKIVYDTKGSYTTEANVTSSGVAALWVTDRFQGKTSTGGKITYKGAPPIVRSGAKFMGGDITRVE